MGRRTLTAVGAAALVISLSGTALAAAPYADENAAGFQKPEEEVTAELYQADVRDLGADHWAAGSVTEMIPRSLMVPDGADRIYPEAAMEDQESIRVFAKALGIAGVYDDTATAVEKAKQAGILPAEGAVEGTMPRIEVARLAAKALDVAPRA